MYDIGEIMKMKAVDVRAVDRNTLKNINDIAIDKNMSQIDRILMLIEQTGGNPYVYEDMGYVVKHSFSNSSNLSFNDCTRELIAKRAGITC